VNGSEEYLVMKSGAKLVVLLIVIFVPVIALALNSIASRIPQTKQLALTYQACSEGCPSPHLWVANVSGWSRVTVQIVPSTEEGNCLRSSANLTSECTRYVEFSDDGIHWSPARVFGPQTVCYGGGLNCICCLRDFIEFPVIDPLTLTLGTQGKFVAITGQNDTRIVLVASR